jgi:hypothetical protein
MSIDIEVAHRAAKFTSLADLDIYADQQYLEGSGREHLLLEAGESRRLADYLKRLQEQIECIAITSAPIAFKCSRGYSLSETGRRLWKILLRASNKAPKECLLGRHLNPWLTLGLHLAWKWVPRLGAYSAEHNKGTIDVNESAPRRMLSHVAKVIRRVCKSRQFRARVNNDTRRAKDNYVSCANLMIELLRRDARLLILRVDLYFEGDAKVLSDLEAGEGAYGKFLRNLREGRVVPDVLGYVGKRECGPGRGIHYHVLVAMDGDKHRAAFLMTERLRSFWVHDCVGSEWLASAFNCWTRRREYKFNGIGLLHYTDSRMLMGVREALEYLCEEGGPVLIGDGRGRNLRKSLGPVHTEGEIRRGAPRKFDHELCTAHQVLLTFDPPPPSPKQQLPRQPLKKLARSGGRLRIRLPVAARAGVRERTGCPQ